MSKRLWILAAAAVVATNALAQLSDTEQRIVAAVKQRTPAALQLLESRKLVELYSKASQDAGLGRIDILDPARRGAGDVQFVAPYTVGIDGLGAAGSGAHTDDEDLEIASIERGAIRAALLIYRLTRP